MLAAMLAAWVSWVIWGIWAGFGLAWELFDVATEHRTGALPLTRIVRDRLMRKHTWARLGVLLFLTWLWVHFVIPLNW